MCVQPIRCQRLSDLQTRPLGASRAPSTETFIKRMARLGLHFHLTVSPPPWLPLRDPLGSTLRAGVLGPLRDPYGPDLRDPSRDGLLRGGTLRGPMALPGVPWLCPPWGVSLTYHSGVERWAVSAWPRKDATLGRPDRHACFPSKGFMPPDVESAKGTTASPS